ncbi:aminofutalosine synthase MqnE [Desulfolucanica intricata]|uniref:aminofutalosine synthase MqnE n=1 Tax=Desulfolucanica intricata TaxID=1285191 RepID=UPI0008367FED|nr:aminofutalosine synthase MqnE [Desulfolucanica intricata]
MEELFRNTELKDIVEKVMAQERLTFEDGMRLFKSEDLLTIGYLANHVCRIKNGDNVHFIVNRHINHTNICTNKCKFCAFGRDPEEKGAYALSLDEIEEKALAVKNEQITEIHIVGGLNPDLKLDFYLETLKRVRRVLPNINITAFTAVEVDYLAKQHNMSVQEVLSAFKKAGLDSLPGGGAEVFAPRVRERICEKKISGERWLEVHENAHKIGIKTNATMLYGHIETLEERVDHLIKLRELQDRTGGFMAFIPLPFLPKNTPMESLGLSRTTGYDDLKILAASRLLLDNFDHIKGYWIMIGPKLAQVSLTFGVDDLDGTVVEEQIAHDAGADTEQYLSKNQIIKLIKSAGRIPVERDTMYNVIGEGF